MKVFGFGNKASPKAKVGKNKKALRHSRSVPLGLNISAPSPYPIQGWGAVANDWIPLPPLVSTPRSPEDPHTIRPPPKQTIPEDLNPAEPNFSRFSEWSTDGSQDCVTSSEGHSTTETSVEGMLEDLEGREKARHRAEALAKLHANPNAADRNVSLWDANRELERLAQISERERQVTRALEAQKLLRRQASYHVSRSFAQETAASMPQRREWKVTNGAGQE
ncbi:hypothetical protein CYLTODRAFT_487171 [Cylindrobasidium torrendii FP15055 ss-10]|uniref:Uncharacterized protein n=1 Tax=Cylindrobasidium torrendii FP15055 ss-10 TaxID=1314674 RepID=A0A0D7BM74_9AGAR|nr:hypothetical protein CYLTODRAFT_487171 [Cylindrobasidium torrendii FP15055 ss-10]